METHRDHHRRRERPTSRRSSWGLAVTVNRLWTTGHDISAETGVDGCHTRAGTPTVPCLSAVCPPDRRCGRGPGPTLLQAQAGAHGRGGEASGELGHEGTCPKLNSRTRSHAHVTHEGRPRAGGLPSNQTQETVPKVQGHGGQENRWCLRKAVALCPVPRRSSPRDGDSAGPLVHPPQDSSTGGPARARPLLPVWSAPFRTVLIFLQKKANQKPAWCF